MNYVVTIKHLHTKTVDGKNDFVGLVEFEYSATSDNVTVSTLSAVSFSAPDTEYTPYADLTQEQVTGWVTASSDINLLQTTLQCKLDALIHVPTAASTTLVKNDPPWTTNIEEAA